MNKKDFHKLLYVCSMAICIIQASPVYADITQTELAGNSLTEYPYFEYVRAFNENATVEVAIDPTRFTGIVGQTCEYMWLMPKPPPSGPWPLP